eukprot:scaffold40279_cov28-Prasinocladus_malaysianus.AAC.1
MEVFMTGLFSIKQAQLPATLMFVTIPLTVAFWVLTTRAFHQPQRIMSMAAAAAMDHSRGKLAISAEELQKIYRPPVMRDVGETPRNRWSQDALPAKQSHWLQLLCMPIRLRQAAYSQPLFIAAPALSIVV